MSLLQLPFEPHLMIAGLLTDDDGELCFADFNSFLKVNNTLYASLNRTLWQEAVKFPSISDRIFTHLFHTKDLAHLKFFLELGADIETRLREFEFHNATPLQVGAQLDNVPLVRILLEHGAGLVQYDKCDHPTYSAIHAARSADMVRLLLDHHADPNQRVFL
jgi:ankyrin repeat protein